MWASRIGLNPGASKSNLWQKKSGKFFSSLSQEDVKKRSNSKNGRQKFGQKTIRDGIDTFVR